MKTAVIFDLDGTMWDSSELVAEAYSKGLEKMGYSLRLSVEDIQNAMGKTMTEIAHMYFDALDPEHAVDIMVKCIEEEMEFLKTSGGVVYDGLEDTLKELKARGHVLACVSNCQCGYIEDFYRLTGLGHYFNDMECWGNTDLPKSENIKLVVERNGVDKAVYVGDTMGDYNSAMGAGTLFVHAAYGYGEVPEGTPAISSIKELPALADSLLISDS